MGPCDAGMALRAAVLEAGGIAPMVDEDGRSDKADHPRQRTHQGLDLLADEWPGSCRVEPSQPWSPGRSWPDT